MSSLNKLSCPQCSNDMDKVYFNIGRYIIIRSYNCNECGFNITDEKYLDRCMRVMRYN
ncbi:MAG: hypothetical protein ABIG89_03970 [Candidatus Woesearchaeota archaeon]